MYHVQCIQSCAHSHNSKNNTSIKQHTRVTIAQWCVVRVDGVGLNVERHGSVGAEPLL